MEFQFRCPSASDRASVRTRNARRTRGLGLGSWARIGLSVAGLACLTGCAASPTQPSGPSDRDATSCPPGFAFFPGSPDPSLRDFVPRDPILKVGTSGVIEACFYRDKVRPAERAAIQWSIADTTIATLSPQTGFSTTVSAKAVGRTTITAIITGVAVTTTLTVWP